MWTRCSKFADYEDLESRYEDRPCTWIEPAGDWGEGSVMLVEIPSDKEVNDNVVAFWRPKARLQAGLAYNYPYRLHWRAAPTLKAPPVRVINTLVGPGGDEGSWLFVLDLAPLPKGAQPRADVSSDKGELRHLTTQLNPADGGWRISFELVPGRETAVELRARLMGGPTPLTETWLYRWTT